MRTLMLVAAFGLMAAPLGATAAEGGNSKMSSCAAAWRAMPAADKAATTYRAYSSACMKSDSAPAAGTVSAKEEVKATTDAKPAKRKRASKTEASAPKANGLPTAKPADATAQCRDDTYSSAKSHAGACAGHGGVASWL